jgi:hypothetical protein
MIGKWRDFYGSVVLVNHLISDPPIYQKRRELIKQESQGIVGLLLDQYLRGFEVQLAHSPAASLIRFSTACRLSCLLHVNQKCTVVLEEEQHVQAVKVLYNHKVRDKYFEKYWRSKLESFIGWPGHSFLQLFRYAWDYGGTSVNLISLRKLLHGPNFNSLSTCVFLFFLGLLRNWPMGL